MSSKYTAFKWESETHTVRTVPGNHCVVSIKSFGNGGTTDAALLDNGPDALGKLLAAAPEMLGALKQAADALALSGAYPVTLGIVQIAIERATGLRRELPWT